MTEPYRLPDSLQGYRVHLVGIKGTGMAALAEILSSRGARITGTDTNEKFYTDAVLKRLSINFKEGFAAENLPADAQLVVHSAAYSREDNPELLAAEHLGIPTLIYPEALGALSALADSSGISGVHGKSTTTAMCGVILKDWGLPATVLVGAEVPGFGSRSTLVQGDRYLVAETCEYRRHFLNFRPRRIVITNIEPDHLDYFRGLPDMLKAFEEYGLNLARGGTLISCADDECARAAAGRIKAQRPDLVLIAYGRTADGPFHVAREEQEIGRTRFWLEGSSCGFQLKVPGRHNVLNAAAALALCGELWQAERPAGSPIGKVPRVPSFRLREAGDGVKSSARRGAFFSWTTMRTTRRPLRRRSPESANSIPTGGSWWTSCPTPTRALTRCFPSSAGVSVPRTPSCCTGSTPRPGRPTSMASRGRTCSVKSGATTPMSATSRIRRRRWPPLQRN